MIICDTSIWIEYFRHHAPYFSKVSELLESGKMLGVECIFGELLQGVLEKRERNLILQCWHAIEHVAETDLWLEAGEYAAIHTTASKGIGLIDAAIAVATLKTNARLWTLDKRLNVLIPERHRFKTK